MMMRRLQRRGEGDDGCWQALRSVSEAVRRSRENRQNFSSVVIEDTRRRHSQVCRSDVSPLNHSTSSVELVYRSLKQID